MDATILEKGDGGFLINMEERSKEPIRFPEDFSESMHPNVPGGTRWKYPKEGDTIISIVGGGYGLHGDGVRTFEMFDFREEGPQDYLTREEINEHLESYPV